MPREERRIYFDYTEAYRALRFMATEKGLAKPPEGNVMNIESSTEDAGAINFIVEKSRTGMVESVPFSRDFILAALMTMCRGIGIPLPKGANKSLEVMPEKFVVRVQMVRK